MAVETDVVIIGLGTGGEDLALQLLDAGLDVVGIEPNLVGGECAYSACIPSKMMIRAGNLLKEAHRVNDVAGRAEVTADWAPVAKRIREQATGNWDDSVAVARFQDRGGRFVRGRGTLTGPRMVNAGGEDYEARRGIVIATGSRPVVPPIPGLSEVAYWTTHDAIQTDPLPESLMILGGGAVGCELGQVFSRFGVDVTIVEGGDRILSREEPETSEIVAAVLKNEGVTVITGVRVEKVSGQGDQIEVIGADGAHHFAEKLLVATGRSVDLSELGLETAGLDSSSRFIAIDDRCRAAEGIWAMGDVTGKAMFTHTAVYQSAIVAADIQNKEPPGADYETLPRVTFTDPEVGSVGLTEATARDRGVDVDVVVKTLPASFRGWLHGPGNDGMIKLVIDRADDVLVGATSVGPHGGEVLGLLTVAMHERVPLERLRHMIYPYPTFHGAIGEALGAYGRGIGTVIDPGFQPLG